MLSSSITVIAGKLSVLLSIQWINEILQGDKKTSKQTIYGNIDSDQWFCSRKIKWTIVGKILCLTNKVRDLVEQKDMMILNTHTHTHNRPHKSAVTFVVFSLGKSVDVVCYHTYSPINPAWKQSYHSQFKWNISVVWLICWIFYINFVLNRYTHCYYGYIYIRMCVRIKCNSTASIPIAKFIGINFIQGIKWPQTMICITSLADHRIKHPVI